MTIIHESHCNTIGGASRCTCGATEKADTGQRPISQIARAIVSAWGGWGKVHYTAKGYLEALATLNGPEDCYGLDDAKTCAIYFIANAASFKGERAKELKAELRAAVGLPKK